MIILSMVITLVGVWKILKTVQLLQIHNPHITVDKLCMVLHSILLILLTFASFAYVLPLRWYIDHSQALAI